MNWRLAGACGVVMCGTAALLSMPAFADQTPTPSVTTYRYDTGRSGYITGQLGLPLALSWKKTTAPARFTTASFTYKDGVIYVAGGPVLYALSAANGQQIWRFPADKAATAPFYNTPVIDGDSIYIGGDDQKVYKLKLATGEQIWAHSVSGEVRCPITITNGKVLLGAESGTFYALNAADGKEIWSQDTGGPITGASSENGTGLISFASSDNKVYGIEEDTGRLIWATRMQTDATASPPVYQDGTFYVGAGRDLYALAERRGNQRWTTRFADNITTPIAVAPGMLYFATAENIAYGVSDRGRVTWGSTLPYPTSTAPLLVGNTVIFACGKGVIFALDATTGKLAWQYVVQGVPLTKDAKVTNDIASAPVYAANTLFVLSDDGSISAFKSSAPDNTGPVFKDLTPAAGSSVNGKGIDFSASIIDEGSGVKPDSVTMTLDGKPVATAKYDAGSNGLVVTQPQDDSDSSVSNLTEGSHQITITATDWRGNTSKVAYGFTVDNSKTANKRRNRGYPGGPGGYPGGPGGYPGGPGGYPGAPGGPGAPDDSGN